MSEFTSIESAYDLAELAKYEDEQKRKRAEEAGALLLDGLGFWVPTAHDVFIGNSAYVWYRLLPDGTGDLDIERLEGPVIGEPQTWWEEYEDTSNFWYDLTGSRWDGTRGMCFALEAGIPPGTPFLMQFGPPHWYKSGYEVEEWDCEYDYEVVRVLPRRRDLAGRSFRRLAEQRQRFVAARDRYQKALDAWQRKNVDKMFILQDLFYWQGRYDEMCPPTGTRAYLQTSIVGLPHEKGKYGWGRQFFSADAHDDWPKTFELLAAMAEKELGMTREQFNKLPKKWRP